MESEGGPENRSPAGRSVGRLSVLAALVACLALAPRIYGRRGRGGGWGPREGGGGGETCTHLPHYTPLPSLSTRPKYLVASWQWLHKRGVRLLGNRLGAKKGPLDYGDA